MTNNQQIHPTSLARSDTRVTRIVRVTSHEIRGHKVTKVVACVQQQRNMTSVCSQANYHSCAFCALVLCCTGRSSLRFTGMGHPCPFHFAWRVVLWHANSTPTPWVEHHLCSASPRTGVRWTALQWFVQTQYCTALHSNGRLLEK